MADIPGIRFTGSPGIERAALAEASVEPRMQYGYLSWPSVNGSTSASPAHRRAFDNISGLGCDELVRWVWEGVEMPGEPTDYHFLLQGAVEQLWSRRRQDPDGLEFVEVFGYLDLALIEAVPQAVSSREEDLTGGFYYLPGIERVLILLEREGALREALALSERTVRFGERYRREDLRMRVAALDGELR